MRRGIFITLIIILILFSAFFYFKKIKNPISNLNSNTVEPKKEADFICEIEKKKRIKKNKKEKIFFLYFKKNKREKKTDDISFNLPEPTVNNHDDILNDELNDDYEEIDEELYNFNSEFYKLDFTELD